MNLCREKTGREDASQHATTKKCLSGTPRARKTAGQQREDPRRLECHFALFRNRPQEKGFARESGKNFPPSRLSSSDRRETGSSDTPVRDPSQARLLGRKKAMETAALWKPWKTKSTLCLPIRLGWFIHRSHSAWKTPSDGVSHSSHSFCGCSHPNESMLWDGARPPVEKPKAVFPPDASRSRREIKGCP